MELQSKKITYASIIHKDEINIDKNINIDKQKEIEDMVCILINNNKFGNIELWKYIYFNHILDIKNIFENGIRKLNLPCKIHTKNIDFLDNFCDFLRVYSSGKIENYIEPLSVSNSMLYLEYITKKS